ncbi:MAG: hypothetical protein ACQEQE_09975, partial [Bacillota bacterium]
PFLQNFKGSCAPLIADFLVFICLRLFLVMPEKKNQHLVPVCYLRNFKADVSEKQKTNSKYSSGIYVNDKRLSSLVSLKKTDLKEYDKVLEAIQMLSGSGVGKQDKSSISRICFIYYRNIGLLISCFINSCNFFIGFYSY